MGCLANVMSAGPSRYQSSIGFCKRKEGGEKGLQLGSPWTTLPLMGIDRRLSCYRRRKGRHGMIWLDESEGGEGREGGFRAFKSVVLCASRSKLHLGNEGCFPLWQGHCRHLPLGSTEKDQAQLPYLIPPPYTTPLT